MLLTTLIWAYASLLTFFYGFWVSLLAKKILDNNKNNTIPIVHLNIVGLVVVSTLAAFMTFFIKIGAAANLLLIVGSVAIYYFNQKEISDYLLTKKNKFKGVNKLILLLFVLAALYILIQTASTAKIYDTGLYHAQAIKWIENYRVIPGLGNVHSRFAFNSHWFITSALFSFSFLGIESFHVLNGWFLTIFIAFCCEGLIDLSKKNYSINSVVKSLYFPAAFILYNKASSSPSPDLPAAVLTWVSLSFFLHRRENKVANVDFYYFAIVLVSVFAVTVKLATIPILLLFIPLALENYKFFIRKISLVVIFMIIPFVARNIIISGYFVYPPTSKTIDIFHFDWKIPFQYAQNEVLWTKSWARMPNVTPDKILGTSIKYWVPLWYRNLEAINKLIIYVTSVLSMLYLFWAIIFIKKSYSYLRAKPGCIYYYACILAGIIFWFVNAPDFRFGYGFIIALTASLTAPLAIPIVKINKSISYINIIIILFVIYIVRGYIIDSQALERIIKKNFIKPEKYSSVQTAKFNSENNLEYYSPTTGDQCWYEALLCTPDGNAKGLRLRGKDIPSGFRHQ